MSVTLLMWLIVGALLIGGELFTGTFYLLIFGLAAWVGATVSFLGYGLDFQLLAAGVAAIAGLALVMRYGRRWRRGSGDDADMDVGNEVRIETILDDRRLKVAYRGSNWDAVVEGGGSTPPQAGGLAVIRAVRGNILVVQPR